MPPPHPPLPTGITRIITPLRLPRPTMMPLPRPAQVTSTIGFPPPMTAQNPLRASPLTPNPNRPRLRASAIATPAPVLRKVPARMSPPLQARINAIIIQKRTNPRTSLHLPSRRPNPTSRQNLTSIITSMKKTPAPLRQAQSKTPRPPMQNPRRPAPRLILL